MISWMTVSADLPVRQSLYPDFLRSPARAVFRPTTPQIAHLSEKNREKWL
jgi:hypothetical protein